ncbi:MAG TPA: alpha/beta hydrolase [Ktedonobacterales bacterium]|nr:alpha/beta hydrolase [Ktedonobacterales bacterium]
MRESPGLVSVQSRLLIGLMRAVGLRRWLGRAFRRRGRPDPHGGGITAMTRRPPAGARVTPVDAGGSPAAWVTPLAANSGAVIYYLHGGGYVFGAMDTYRDLLGRLTQLTGARALWLDYRLAPECPFPAAVDDALAGYRWLLAQGAAPEAIVFSGDSAGGGLALATMLAARDAGLPLPAGGALLSPWTDLTGESETAISRAAVDPMLIGAHIAEGGQRYLAGADPRHPLASPLYADLRGLPPLLIHVGDNETLLDDSRKLAERARAAGVEVTLRVWDSMFHVFPIFPTLLPEARKAVDEMVSFILARVSRSA